MRKLAAIATMGLTLLCVAPIADAQVEPVGGDGLQYCGSDQLGRGLLCDPEELAIILAGTAGGGSSTPSTSGSGGNGIRYYSYDRLTTGPDGKGCVTTGYAPEGTTPSDLLSNDLVTQGINDIHGLPLEYPPCPQRPQVAGQLAPVETRSMLARRAWEHVLLPEPRPAIAPGRAITGKRAYLETRGDVAFSHVSPTVFGELRIAATGSYTITWGDGETSGPHTFEGQAWPDGRITHDYLNVGNYDITVTERWTARWSLGGQSGVLRTLQTSGRIDDFPVEQLQAVIGR